MGYTSHLEGLLEQKQEEIRLLEGLASANTARIAILQTRLMSTLDTLDAVQDAHTQEIGNMNEKMERLRDKLRCQTELVESAEIERDDMRDAVLKLVEKVEASNGYANWPQSRIQLSCFPDNLTSTHVKRSKAPEDDELLSYAASIINRLRKERDDERRSHARSCSIAEARVLTLEAQLSRREAELEAYSGLTKPAAQLHGWRLTDEHPISKGDEDPIHSRQVISMLDLTVSRNKVLEVEIKALVKRLEDARAVHVTDPPDEPPSYGRAIPLGGPALERLKHSGTIPPSGQHDLPIKRSGSKNKTANPAISSSKGANLPSQQSEGGKNSKRRKSSDYHILQDLDRQIRELGDKVDGFTDERAVLLQTLATNIVIPLDQPPIGPEAGEKNELEHHLRELELECDRLKASEHAVLQELEATRTDFRARETELVQELISLRFTVNDFQEDKKGVSNPLVAPHDNDGEVSMELATPLLPTSIISTYLLSPPIIQAPALGTDDEDTLIPPPLPPLPPPLNTQSNDYSLSLPSPTPSSTASDMILDYDYGTTPRISTPQLVSSLRRVEMELVDTQRHLETGESALDLVEDLIHELHL